MDAWDPPYSFMTVTLCTECGQHTKTLYLITRADIHLRRKNWEIRRGILYLSVRFFMITIVVCNDPGDTHYTQVKSPYDKCHRKSRNAKENKRGNKVHKIFFWRRDLATRMLSVKELREIFHQSQCSLEGTTVKKISDRAEDTHLFSFHLLPLVRFSSPPFSLLKPRIENWLKWFATTCINIHAHAPWGC